jgi:hypothetical protein
MPEVIKGMFFTDKLRSICSILLLTLLFGAVMMSWAFPRHSSVDKETVDSLKQVSSQLERAADSFEKQSNVTAQLNATLQKTLDEQESIRDDKFKTLLNRYGVVAPPPVPDPLAGVVLSGDHAVTGLRPEDHSLRGEHVPPGTSLTSRNKQLQDPIADHEAKTDGDAPAVPSGKPKPAS